MNNLLDLVQSQISGEVLKQLTNKIGANQEQTQAATEGIVSMITSALAKNAASPEGASSLSNALESDHDGSILDQVGDLINGNLNSRASNGAGILKHILGNKQGNAADMISQMSGLSNGQTGNLMAMLAPIVLGMLGKQKRENNLDQGGLADMLSGSVKTASNKRKELGLIGKFLDRDGDGSVIDDVAGMIGSFLKRR